MTRELETEVAQLLVDGLSVADAVRQLRAKYTNLDEAVLFMTARAARDRLDRFTAAPVDEQRRQVSMRLLAISDTCRQGGDPKHELKALEQLTELNGLQLEPGTRQSVKDLPVEEIDKRIAELLKKHPDMAPRAHSDA